MYRIGPISRKSNFHSREKCLIGLVLATLCLFCFGGIFLLPDNFGSDRVLRAYKQFQKAGPEIFIPAPPLAAHAPKDTDPHFIGDREKLQAKIKEELGELLDKPFILKDVKNILDKNEIVEGSEIDTPLDDQQQQGAAPPVNGAETHENDLLTPIVDDAVFDNVPDNIPVGNLNLQLPQAKHADADPSVEEKRQKVKEVWSDYKIHLKAKLRKNKNNLSETGGGPERYCSLTSLEEQVQKLLSMEETIVRETGAVSIGACLEQDSVVCVVDADKENSECNNENGQLTSQTPSTSRRRTRHITVLDGRDSLLQKQVDGQRQFHKECLTKMDEIHCDLKYMGKQYKKILEIKEKKLELAERKFLFKKKEAAEKRELLNAKLQLKKNNTRWKK